MDNAATTFFAHPLESLKAIFAPANSIGADSLSAARVRAYGVDPSTGALIAPQYAAAAAAGGFDASNPGGFITTQENQVTSEFLSDRAAFTAEIPLLPSIPNLPGLPDLSTPSGFVAIVVVLAMAFFLIKAVK